MITFGEAGQLADVLSQAFREDVSASRILEDSGLEDVRRRAGIGKVDGGPEWFRILLIVPDRAEIERLLSVAVEDQPGNEALIDALAQFRAGIARSPREPEPSPPETPRGIRHPPPVIRSQRPLVDRVQAVDVIRSEIAKAATDQHGSRLLLIGDSGVGKSRLAEEGAQLADEQGMAVIFAQCVDQNAEPLLPLRDGLGQFRQDIPVRDLLSVGGTALMDYAPFLESFLGIGAPGTAPAPLGGSASRGVYDGLAQVLVGIAGQSGLCLVVDDLADADRDTVSFLSYLGRKAAGTRLITIITAREDLLQPDLKDSIDGWRVAGCSILPVPPFAREDAREFITLIHGGELPRAEWVDEVFEFTGGNPFFIEQVVGLAAETADGALRLADVPARIEAVVTRRLRRVTPEFRSFLGAAAVALEITQQLELVAHVAGLDVDAASGRLSQAVADRYLAEDPLGKIGFAQKVVQRVLYNEIAPHERTALNLRAAEWLERAGMSGSASYHYSEAGRSADMVRTALDGAGQAEHAGMYATAVQFYLRARPAGDPVAIGLRLARDYLILGRWAEAEDVLSSLPSDLGEARILRSDLLFVRGSFDRALREMRLASQDPAVDSTEALTRLADIHMYLGRLRTAMEIAERALDLTTDGTKLAKCHAVIGTSRYHLGDFTGAEEAYLKELNSLPQEVEQRDRVAYTVALHNLGLAREAHDDWLGAKRFHEEALRLRLEVSAAREVGHSRHALIRCEIGLRAFDSAREMLAEARASAVALGEKLEQGKLDHTEARLELLTGGDAQRAIRLIEAARDRFCDLQVAYDVAHASFSLAQAYERAGDARRSLEEAAAARAQMQRGEFGILATLFPDIAYWYYERVEAGLLAFAAGDAVGLPWERKAAAEIDADALPVLRETDEWPAGATSDDTSLTLLVAEELVATGHADAASFMQRLVDASPAIRGLGPSTTAAISRFRETGQLPTVGGNTNGALMRSLAVGWALPIDRAQERRAWVVELSRATHTGAEAITAAAIGAACAAWAIEGASAAQLLEIAREEAAATIHAHAADPRIIDMLAAVAAGTWEPAGGPEAMDPYETVARALWCIVREAAAADAVLAAVRLGGDTDTVAALVGGLVGCRLGPADVRRELSWIDEVRLPPDEEVQRLARGIAALRESHSDG